MAQSFEEYRHIIFSEQKEQNNASLIEGLTKTKEDLYELPYADTTVEKVRKLLRRNKVSEGSRNKLFKNGHVHEMVKTRGTSIDALCQDVQKINVLSMDTGRQTLHEKAAMQYWSQKKTDGLTLNPLPKKGLRFVRKKMESSPVEAFNRAVSEVISFVPTRLGGAGRAIGNLARQRDNLKLYLNPTITTIDMIGDAEKSNCSTSFDAELIDQSGNFKGYAVMKYQKKMRGGAQDRQKDDVRNTVRMCADYIRTNPDEKNTIFYFIMDGPGLVPNFLDELKKQVDYQGIGDRVFVKTNSV